MDNHRVVITIDINGLVENRLVELPQGFTSSSLIEHRTTLILNVWEL